MLSFSLGKWSENLRSGMAGWFSLFNFFRNLNCAPIHILISSELNIQFLYNLANIQAALRKAGMLFFLSLPPKGYASSCAPPLNRDKQWWHSKSPFTLPCFQWHPNHADPSVLRMRWDSLTLRQPSIKLEKCMHIPFFSLPLPQGEAASWGILSQHWALLA